MASPAGSTHHDEAFVQRFDPARHGPHLPVFAPGLKMRIRRTAGGACPAGSVARDAGQKPVRRGPGPRSDSAANSWRGACFQKLDVVVAEDDEAPQCPGQQGLLPAIAVKAVGVPVVAARNWIRAGKSSRANECSSRSYLS